MALARVYTVDVNQGSGLNLNGQAAGTEYILMYGASSGEFNISAVRIGLVSSAASSSYPSNGSVTFRLRAQAPSTTSIFVGTATATTISQSTTTASSAWIFSTWNGSGTGTYSSITGGVKWSQTLPYTAGANWGEWFTPGWEINTTNATLALTIQSNNGTGSNVAIMPEFMISE